MDHKQKIINRKIWVLICGSGLSTLGIFISIPIITIYAMDYFKLSVVQVGFISGIWPVTQFSMSFFCGIIAERWGYLRTLRLGIILNSMSFLFMAISVNLIQFSLSLVLFGLGKAFSDNSVRATMIALAEEDEVERYFRLRYLLQNVGNVLGPLIGVAAYGLLFGNTFILSTVVFLMFLFATFIWLRLNDFRNEKPKKNSTVLKTFLVLKDTNLQLWILSSMFIIIAYGAYEGLMPAVVLGSGGDRPAYGVLVSLNALVVIVFQLIQLRLFKDVDINKSIVCGFFLLTSGFFLFALDWNAFVMTIVATIVVSVGEAILFPCFDVIMGRIAPSEQKAVYYGAGGLSQVGFFIGPSIGGLLLEYGGSVFLFIACSTSIIFSGIIFNKISKERNNKVSTNVQQVID
ncbi:MFS transporter [Bacillus cereus]|nr:MFS transporter [Bacillus cereus]